jgi:hypothetical protein
MPCLVLHVPYPYPTLAGCKRPAAAVTAVWQAATMFWTQVAIWADWVESKTCGAEKVWVTVTMTLALGTPAVWVTTRRMSAIASALIEVRSMMTRATLVTPFCRSRTRT